MDKYKYFGDVYKDEDTVEAVAELLRKKITFLDVREWVTLEDMYVDEKGDIYYVDWYKHHTQIEEGHGLHDVGWDEPEEYKLFITKNALDELVASNAIDREEAEDDLKGWQWTLIFAGVIAFVWFTMWVIIG